MKVYFVRHGESQFNTTKKHQHKDVPLTEKGIEQAQALSKRLRNHQIDNIISSRYERASQTAIVIGKTINVPVEYNDLLFEVRVPSELVGKATTDEDVRAINQQIIDNFCKEDWKYSDEESFADLRERGGKVLAYVTNLTAEAVVIVSHARMIRFLLAMIMFGEDLKPEQYMGLWCLELSNSAVSIADYHPEKAQYNNNNPWRVITINDHSHLP